MNNFYFKPQLLLSGQEAPFTGKYVNAALARNACFTVFSSGENVSGDITLQYKSPFFKDDGVSFYSFTGLSAGYADPIFLTTPMSEIRAIADGTGHFWTAITIQN
jgi:hypothetical protein